MTSATHEHTLNVALGEVLGRLRLSWRTRSEQTGHVLMEGGRPDILIEEASGWPIAIEAERSNHASVEADAQARLGRTVASTGRQIETAIALVYPANLHSLDGRPVAPRELGLLRPRRRGRRPGRLRRLRRGIPERTRKLGHQHPTQARVLRPARPGDGTILIGLNLTMPFGCQPS